MLTAEGLRTRMQANDWFRDCSAALQDALLAHGRERHLRAGEHLFRSGAPDGGLHCVLSGSISVQSVDAHDEMPMLLVLEPCHWFGELALIDGRPRSHDAVADVASVVWCVPQTPMEAWLDGHPRHWREIAREARLPARRAGAEASALRLRVSAAFLGRRQVLCCAGRSQRATADAGTRSQQRP